MKVLTFSKKVTVHNKHAEHVAEINCNPGERLIFDNDNALCIQQSPGSAGYIWEVSDLDPMLEEIPRPIHWKKKRVLFYRNRGFGDQLIMSSVPRFFREVLGADSHCLADRVHEPIWAHNPYIGGVPLSVPMHIDSVWRQKPGRPFFDGTFFIESATEWDSDSEQPNVYDRLFAMVGMDPARVPIKYKRPIFAVAPDDIERRIAWLQQTSSITNRDLSAGYIFVQLRATNKVRSIPPKLADMLLGALEEIAAKKGLTAILADNQPLTSDLAQEVAKLRHVVNVTATIPNIRLFGTILGGAMLVVGPDSVALHFAAAFETPAVGIWGPFSPESRCKYYPNQTHLFHPEMCDSAPCYNYLAELPLSKCPWGTKQETCEVYEGIKYEELYSAILEGLP
jgi:ADP-heptose:LPS heptosyltransferase